MKAIIILALLTISNCHIPETRFLKGQRISDNIITAINSDLTSTWKAGINEKFNDMEIAKFKTYLGAVISPYESYKDYIINGEDLYGDEDIPEHFDLREKYPQCFSLSEVNDQSSCGSSWAFSVTETISDRICIQMGEDVRLSYEDLLTCCSTCGSGCNGGCPFQAFLHYNAVGIVTGGAHDDYKYCKPYSFAPCEHHTIGKYQPCGEMEPTPKCTETCFGDIYRTYSEDKYKGSKPRVLTNEEST